MFILIVFRRFFLNFSNSLVFIHLAIHISLVFATYRGGGELYDDSNFSCFWSPIRRTYIFLSMLFSLLSFHLPFSLFILFYAGLFPVVYLIYGSSQNKIDITVFFSLRPFAYLFTFSFHVIIIFIAFRLLSLSISTFFFFFLKLNSF